MDFQTTCPTFARLLHPQSRLGRNLKTLLIAFCCAAASFTAMTLLVSFMSVVYLHAWGSIDRLAPSQSLVLPASLLISAALGSVLGAQLGLARWLRAVAMLAGLLAFSCAGGEWVTWFIPAPIAGLFDGWSFYMLCQEIVLHTFGTEWILLGLWTAAGLLPGMLWRPSQRLHLMRALAGMAGFLLVSSALLVSVIYPMARAERDEADFWGQRVSDLSKTIYELKNEPRQSTPGPVN